MMNYSKYIDLGFTRTDFEDRVEFEFLGRNTFVLTKKINERIGVVVSSEQLDKPKLYIKKDDTDYHPVIDIPEAAVFDIFTDE
jgi:hypothetical protein